MNRIVWAAAARRDINAIWDRIAQESPRSAELVDSAILRVVAGLADHPERGRPGRVVGTRELVIPGLPYIAVYIVRENGEIGIARILHGAMRWPPLRDVPR